MRFKQPQGEAGADPELAKWLDVPADRIGELLALDLPRGCHVEAGRACLRRDGEPSAALTRALASRPGLAITLFRPDEAPGGDAERPVRLFEALLTEAPSHPWFEDMLARAGTTRPHC